ncbi:spermine oxidase-like [Microplitis mediator]|uniref:spermine oxidase-like n=1 Tax=Microplitis mediator TaxID=375433 RepID=UPI0025577922|nr:spermine oxidase-like [Microplitis mediator]
MLQSILLIFIIINSIINNFVSTESNHDRRIIIVGTGASGIAAASKLFQNDFKNIKLIEAENRIGGRLWAIKIGDYMLDMGGQWVHGEKNNVAFELAWPLGLIEPFNVTMKWTSKIYKSDGSSLSEELSTSLSIYYHNVMENTDDIDDSKAVSYGEHAQAKLEEFFKTHPEITDDLKKPLLHYFNLIQGASDGSDDWNKISAKSYKSYLECEGDQSINWKERTYSTILDILMKKYPNPEEELPIINNTIINSKVVKINLDTADAPVQVITQDGKTYLADHVIVTSSLGVLKADYDKLFNPPLPDNKINAIQNIEMGHVAKIFLFYDNPWWLDGIYVKSLIWTEQDKNKIENNPETKWLSGVYAVASVEHKPKIMCLWMTGPYVTEMEQVPEDKFRSQILELLNQFLGHSYNITQPSEIVRSMWNTNDNFRGTYSWRSVNSDLKNARNEDLAEPIMRNDKPVILFAGEATDERYSTVHGAINSGWREADRLINLY